MGFIGCTYGIQGAGPKDSERAFKQIMFCFQGEEPNRDVLKEIKRLSAEVDIVVFTPHWGTEYSDHASRSAFNFGQPSARGATFRGRA